MMDKSCESDSSASLPSPETESFMQEMVAGRGAVLNIILCTDAIRKTRFLVALADMAPGPVCYVDTDLLYAGCMMAGLHKRRKDMTILCPDQDTWHESLAGIISTASVSSSPPPTGRMTIVLDSLNGIYEMFGGADAAMSANTHIMAMASLAGQAGSSVIIGARAKKRRQRHGSSDGAGDRNPNGSKTGKNGAATYADKEEEWATHPGGRQIPKMFGVRSYLLEGTGESPLLVRLPAAATATATATQ